MIIYFSHGKESGPWGSKIRRLAEQARSHGFEVDSIDYTDLLDPDQRVERLQQRLAAETRPYALVGSSMGGYVSTCCAKHARGLFLLAPALYMPGYGQQNYSVNCPTTVVHGWSDDIIPYQNSVRFAEQGRHSLHLIAGDHRLNSSLDAVCALFEHWCLGLEKVPAP